VRRVKIMTFYARIYSKTTTTILQNEEHHCPRPSANDLQAFGVFEAARQAGLRIPQDLSVVGFDDISHARWSGPQLTTVRQPFREMGATAAEIVLAMAAGETVRQSHVELAVQLIVRNSTAARVPAVPRAGRRKKRSLYFAIVSAYRSTSMGALPESVT